jgi:hypothetical protein
MRRSVFESQSHARSNLNILNLMHRPIINIRRHSLNDLAIIVDARVPLLLLFVSDVVCRLQSANVKTIRNATHSRLAQA